MRLLVGQGAQLRVILTRAACDFITPLTLQAVSGNPVYTESGPPVARHGMDHIDLAEWCDAILVAPASADCLARLSIGRADDLLACVCLATRAPLALAPAMNHSMWLHPATQENARRLRLRGVRIFGPADGAQACGAYGPGRMLEPARLAELLEQRFSSGVLAGRSLLITAGPTREPIDPVRYLGNRSSGRMGYALAEAARAAGGAVTLVSGPVELETPQGVARVDVSTAAELRQAVQERIADCDIFISAAAVADFRCRSPHAHKLKKDSLSQGLELHLEPTPDILAEVARMSSPPFLVGFAAETEALAEHARAKLQSKGLDMIVANQVGADQGFGDVQTQLEIFWQGRRGMPASRRQGPAGQRSYSTGGRAISCPAFSSKCLIPA